VAAKLAVQFCGIELSNPIIAASGTIGYGVEFLRLLDLNSLGAIVVKGLSKDPIDGNPAPRLWEAEGGMVNSVGLQNVGVRAFVKDKLPQLRGLKTKIFANVFGYAAEDYVDAIRILENSDGIDAYELNVSCPNTKHGGIYFSSDPACLADLVKTVKSVVHRRPLIVKLSPNVAAIEPLARAAEDAGADALSLVNTFISLPIDARTRRPRVGAGFGGLSGPAIKPMALRFVYQAAKAVKIPVIGMGGIATGEDAAEFLVAGARAVEVGTATFWDPSSTARIIIQLGDFLKSQDIADVNELVGTLKL
jgi:dihydroorotate dehydrogenase (NAD+) catalytic subunit